MTPKNAVFNYFAPGSLKSRKTLPCLKCVLIFNIFKNIFYMDAEKVKYLLSNVSPHKEVIKVYFALT